MRRARPAVVLRAGAGLVVALLAVAACTSRPTPAPTSQATSPFAACPAPTVAMGSPVPATGGGAAARDLPAVSLPCFTGGEPVTPARLGRPAVINFWASFCSPCRKELPQLQKFADATTGRVVVLGVVTTDTRTAAASAGEAFGVRFPALFDPDGTLLNAWGRSVLPVTLFVDANGRVRHEDVSGALTYERLVALSAEYLGVSA